MDIADDPRVRDTETGERLVCTSPMLSLPSRLCCLPALLQSTRKELFWPTKAFDSPAPLEVTLLASEDDLGMAL